MYEIINIDLAISHVLSEWRGVGRIYSTFKFAIWRTFRARRHFSIIIYLLRSIEWSYKGPTQVAITTVTIAVLPGLIGANSQLLVAPLYQGFVFESADVQNYGETMV